ncbi:hypothetical protein ITJ38_06025 [Agreia pratensis]|uniref:Uncharacterized protein n=1 Tax=Agreia pratensis TaxID=150121 RepID=A0A1X7L8G0_9MICO|nr:hypothetical protein [Agreia pratensis]MBF4633956.1 hypothetical protein [Agreia pratensis]SMG49683.1 hypothetical protein SAMN06296010_3431 [Agreia pratensis]
MSQNESAARPGADEEYPDAAGYPDGTGTLDEGTSASTSADRVEDAEGVELEQFSMTDEEDLEN